MEQLNVCDKPVLILILMIGFLITGTVGNTNVQDNLFHDIETFDTNGIVFEKLLFDSGTKALYAGATNGLYRINTTNMTLLETVATGPELNSIECDPSEPNCNRVTTDNHAKVLLFDPEYNKILFCGSINQGLCQLYDKLNLGNPIPIKGEDDGNIVNYISGQDSVVARYGVVTIQNKNYNVLYVGQEYDSRPMKYSPAVFSTRLLTKENRNNDVGAIYNIEYLYHNTVHKVTTAKDIHKDVKDSYRVKFIHAFEYENFSFYLTVQRQYVDHGEYYTRLVRICNKDIGYYSYTEIELACRKKNGVTSFFNIAEAAYVGGIGAEFGGRFSIDESETILYVVFGKNQPHSNSPEIDESSGSGLCLFAMSTLMREYQIAQKDCYNGNGNLLPWIHPTNVGCVMKTDEYTKIDQDNLYCGDDPTNDAIGRRGYQLQTETNVTLAGHYATSILVQIQNEKTVAILGTAKGTILKVLIDGTNAPPYIDINIAPPNVPDPRVARDMSFDERGNNIFAMTNGRIAKVPIQTCGVYSNCSSCVSTRDALNCGWCSDGAGFCSSRSKCASATWQAQSCPPSLFNFEPRSGPVQGGTTITLTGANFGNATAAERVKVTVAFEPCKVIYQNQSVIICTSGPSTMNEKSNLVELEIVDTSKTTVSFEIRGEVDLGHISFSYKEPHLDDVTPKLGPKSGGSRLTVTGLNLDIGSHLDISVVNLPCVPFSVKSAEIQCKTSALPLGQESGRKKRSLVEGDIKIIIDGVLLSKDDLTFSYEEDPFVENVHPRRSIASGGIMVTVTGGNLHVVHRPQIVIQDTAIGVNYHSDCEVRGDNDVMLCSSPALQDHKENGPSPGNPLTLTLNFAMDGVDDLIDFPSYHPELCVFEYFVDPKIHMFDDQHTVITFYTNQNFLEIKGEHLNEGASLDDYTVTIADEDCQVTSVKEDALYCRPVVPQVLSAIENTRPVTVLVGKIEFQPGSILYKEDNMNILLATILAPLLGVLAVFILIVVLVWMRKTRKGPFKYAGRSIDELPTVRFTRGENDVVDGRDRLIQSNPYTSSTQMLRQRHVAEREQEPLINSDCRKFLEESHLLVNMDDLQLLEIIGQGNFGCVFKGLLTVKDEKQRAEVAVKTLKTLTEASYTSTADAKSFLEEALRMRDFDHPNILRLIGIALDKEEQPLVILPFMKHGDLLTFIRDETNSPTIKDLMDFGIQVSEGMAYLSKLKFVHRDLAARNCMLNDSMEVQVADFGLSRDIYEKDYYSSDGRKAKLPVKWMALESLEKGIYNSKTDVWSYGVVLWELMTRGVTPYPEVDNWEIIKFLKPGRRMPQPAYCPDSLYRLMLQCWDPEGGHRPAFHEIVTQIQRIMYEMENRQEPQQATSAPHIYANVPTTQTYLYPSTIPQYSMHRPTGLGESGDIVENSNMFLDDNSEDTVEFNMRDHNENEHMPSMFV